VGCTNVECNQFVAARKSIAVPNANFHTPSVSLPTLHQEARRVQSEGCILARDGKFPAGGWWPSFLPNEQIRTIRAAFFFYLAGPLRRRL